MILNVNFCDLSMLTCKTLTLRVLLLQEVMSLSDNSARQNGGEEHVQGIFNVGCGGALGDRGEPF